MKRMILNLAVVIAGLAWTSQTLADPVTPENTYLTLRKQMANATTPKQQKSIITQIGETGTFQGMMYVAQFLQDDRLRTTAARVVAHIAVAHPEYNGANTRQLLQDVLPILKKADQLVVAEYLNKASNREEGYVSIFNGRDLTGWKGLVENPIKRRQMDGEKLVDAQRKADEVMRQDWTVQDGCLTYVGHGYDNICTVKDYKDFEMYVDWRLDPNGKEPDAGIYLRGTPQVQIWDIARVNVGAQVGSGGLYNNKKNVSTPSSVADNKLGEWNTFYIKIVGDKVTVRLNGVTVVDNVTMENYWDRSQPLPACDQIEMQAHGSLVNFRDIYVREIKEKP
ncbi:MAG: DUF1080 domain-containing protein [Bacteroidaceae bacterium]|nr:DUF1080 domain-containing protein [Bacteroidaceae bacterium]